MVSGWVLPLSVVLPQLPQLTRQHRRSHSLPPATSHLAGVPRHRALNLILDSMNVHTYRFHSGLAGDINVQELMAESKLSFTFPQQLLWVSIWLLLVVVIISVLRHFLFSPWESLKKCHGSWIFGSILKSLSIATALYILICLDARTVEARFNGIGLQLQR